MLLLSDPTRWSLSLAKTKLRVFLWFIVHIVFMTAGLYLIFDTYISDETPQITFWKFAAFSGFPIYFMGVLYPTLYIVAIYKLLKMTDSNVK